MVENLENKNVIINRTGTGTCAFIGYSAQAREHWIAHSKSRSLRNTANKFGECAQCNTGLRTESDYVMIVHSVPDEQHIAPFIRCISCYVAGANKLTQ